MSEKKRYFELNYFNALSCLFVILIHVLSIGISYLRNDSFQLALIYIPWKFAGFVVPAFLFSGAVKMALSFDGEKQIGYFQYVFRRILKIYIPYCLWVGIYYLYFLNIGWVEPGFDVFLRYLFVGDLSSPFYYIVLVMQFYLLMPVWKKAVQKIPFFAAIPVSALISLAMLNFENFLAYFGIEFLWRDRIFPTYIFFWITGLYVGKYYDSVKSIIKKHFHAFMCLSFPIFLYVLLMYWQYRENVYIFNGNTLKLMTDIITVFFVLALCIAICEKNYFTLKKILSFIYSASFTVYLSHCLFLQIIQSLMDRLNISDMGILITARAAVCYTAPFLMWFVFNKIRLYSKKCNKIT